MKIFLISTVIFLILLLIGVIFYYRYKEKKLLGTLNQMLSSAINGTFKEEAFDESVLSSLQTKFNQYLCSCEVSRENLSETKDKISGLISDISHQTKTPIANILLYSQLLSEQYLQGDSKDFVTALSSQAEKLNFLIGSLIKTSRLENGIVTLNPQKNTVLKMLKKAINQVLLKAKDKNIDIDIFCGEEQAIFDEKWTIEAIYNIIDNAVKYTNKGGKIKISITEYQLFLRIDIKDNGIGINENEQSKIFTRFYRSQEVSQTEGVGIGLYLVRKIISGQGGYIKLSSKPSVGSTFSIFLPREI